MVRKEWDSRIRDQAGRLRALTHIETLAKAAPRMRDPAGKAQIDGLQQALRRFGQTHATDSLVERAELDAEVAQHARLREQFDEPGDLVETGNIWERYTNLTRFTSGCRALLREFISGVDGERVRWLLPRTYNGCCRRLTAAATGGLRPLLPRAYGGTGKGKRRRDERVEGYFGWLMWDLLGWSCRLFCPPPPGACASPPGKRKGRATGKLFTKEGGWRSTYSYVTTHHSSLSRDTSRCCI